MHNAYGTKPVDLQWPFFFYLRRWMGRGRERKRVEGVSGVEGRRGVRFKRYGRARMIV